MSDPNGPALQPPDGVIPRLDNPPNLNAYACATFVICLFFGTTATAIRLYSKFFLVKSVHLGDYLLFAAYVSHPNTQGLFVALIAYMFKTLHDIGIFVHQWNVRLRDIPVFLNYVLLMTNLFTVFIPTIKIAICIEWLHLFSTNSKRGFVFWSCHAVIWVNFILYAVLIIYHNVIPIDRFWATNGETDISSSAINLATDLLMLAIPQRTIWGLQMTRRKKAGVSMVFTMGIIACVAATIRLAYSIRQAINPKDAADATYGFSAVIITAITEAVCGILVMCVPSFPMAFKTFSRLRGWHVSNLSGSSNKVRRSTKSANKGAGRSSDSEARGGRKQYEEIDGENGVPLGSVSKNRLEPEWRVLRTTDIEASYSSPKPAHPNQSLHHTWERDSMQGL